MAEFLAGIDSPTRRADADRLIALMSAITGEPAVMWGPSIIGFGSYHYRYPTGYEGVAAATGFSPRKAALSIYAMATYFPETAARGEALLARLGKHRRSKACLYVNKLADIDEAVLAELIKLSYEQVKAMYP